MLKVRCIDEGEIEAFIDAYADPAARTRIQRYFTDSETKSSWCFTAENIGGGAEEDAARRAALVCFRIDPNSQELFVTDLDLPWEGDYLGIGKMLLKESAAIILSEGITRLELRVSDNNSHFDKLSAVVESSGYSPAQSKTRYVLENFLESLNAANKENRLTFRSRTETGNEEFVNAIRRVTEGTLDRVDRLDRARLGAEEAARRYFDILCSIEDEPRRWFLAYDAHGELAGLVVCQLFADMVGCINYIGVVPERRGTGYSLDLICKASEAFRGAGAVKKIIADIDTENLPLAKNLILAGYRPTRNFLVFEMHT